METAIFNGLNVGKLSFDYSIRYRPKIIISPQAMLKQTIYLFNGINYEYVCYAWEKDKDSSLSHSHNLIKTTDSNLIFQLQLNLKSNKEPYCGNREVLYQQEKKLTNPSTGEKIIYRMDKKEVVEFHEIRGKHGIVHIERVLGNVSSSIYTNKFTNHGANFGYVLPNLK